MFNSCGWRFEPNNRHSCILKSNGPKRSMLQLKCCASFPVAQHVREMTLKAAADGSIRITSRGAPLVSKTLVLPWRTTLKLASYSPQCFLGFDSTLKKSDLPLTTGVCPGFPPGALVSSYHHQKKNCSLLRTGWVEATVGKLLNYNRTVISVSFRLIQDPNEGAVWPERCLSFPCVLF